MKAGAVRWPAGEPEDQEVPDPDNRGRFVTVDQLPAEDQNPTLPVVNRFPRNRASALARIRRQGCTNDIQVHIGTCEDPRDYDGGWESGKILVLEGASITDYSTDELGALQSSERATVNETGAFAGSDYYEILGLGWGETAASNIAGEVIDVAICDRPSCGGLCGSGSDGCQRVFAVTLNIGSVGAGVGVAYSSNGGSTWSNSDMDAASGGDPTGLACVGPYLVVISQTGEAHAYTRVDDLVAGTAVWAEVTTGYVATKGPNALSSVGATLTWIVGQGGYIYFSSNITSAVVEQSPGSITTENLNAVHAFDADNVVAVGANNAVLRTVNGGDSWGLIVGPASGVALNTVVMLSAEEWIIGTANGRLWSTDDAGLTWTEIGFDGQGTGVVESIKMATGQVGYMSHTLLGVGRIFRTTNRGSTWKLQTGVPVADRYNALAVCNNANRVFAAGLAGDATDGIIAEGVA